MAIVIDGERSKARLTIGQKKLALIKMLDLPAKAGLHGGFLVRSQQQDGMEKIIIKAPMGAAVLCSTAAGLFLVTADYWLGDFTPAREVHVADLTLYPGLDWDCWYTLGDEVPNAKLVPSVVSTYGYQNAPPAPALLPTGGEAFYLSVRAYAGKHLYETCRNFYAGAGKAPKRTGDMRIFGGLIDRTFYQLLASAKWFRTYEHYLGSTFNPNVGMYPLAWGKLVYANHTEWDKEGWAEEDLLAEVLFAGITTFVKDKLLGQTHLLQGQGNFSRGQAIGAYAFAPDAEAAPVSLHGFIVPLPITYDSGLNTYFNDNPTEKKWLLFFALRTGGVTYLHGANQFLALLDQFASGAGTDYPKAQAVFRQLFPGPNYQPDCPYDSVMFHSHEGDIYTWTRHYGAVKFSTTGLTAATLTLPAEVTGTAGVRPVITHAGDGVYLCVCEKLAETETGQNQILGVYRGSPFTGWTQLSGAEGLVHVRPVKVTADDTLLLGVMLIDGEFFFAAFQGSWKKLGKLAVPATSRANWAAGLFGDGAPILAGYPSPPPVLMQMPTLPYSVYEGLLP